MKHRSLYPSHPYFRNGAFIPFAHRGGARRFPENTRPAFEGAKALGYQHIETDVQLTSDGEIVVFHDPTLDRTTNGCGRVCEHAWSQLAELDAAYRFCPSGDGRTFPLRGSGITPLRLRELVDAYPDLYLNLEMKGDDLRLADALGRLIEDAKLHERVLIASANDALVHRFRERSDGRIPTSAGKNEIIRFWGWTRVARWAHSRSFPFDVLQVPFSHGFLRVVDVRFVTAAQAAGIPIHVWTIDDPLLIRALEDLGVDGIMTDRPGVLLETLSTEHWPPR